MALMGRNRLDLPMHDLFEFLAFLIHCTFSNEFRFINKEFIFRSPPFEHALFLAINTCYMHITHVCLI